MVTMIEGAAVAAWVVSVTGATAFGALNGVLTLLRRFDKRTTSVVEREHGAQG